jgi:hypothetical protein
MPQVRADLDVNQDHSLLAVIRYLSSTHFINLRHNWRYQSAHAWAAGAYADSRNMRRFRARWPGGLDAAFIFPCMVRAA